MIRLITFAVLLLITACSHQNLIDDRWTAYNNTSQGLQRTGNIEYNGIGGSGRQQDPTPENGIGGSGIQLNKAQANGLGGSGRQASETIENGLGGSGKAAILGPISAFGSIWVNDRHIQLPDSTEYLIAGKEAQRADLRLGQVVAVLADSLSDTDYQALEVHLLYNVVGLIESITSNSSVQHEIALLGQKIIVDNNTRIENAHGKSTSFTQLARDRRIAVSGIRMPNQKIKATLIVLKPEQKTLLAGPISVIDGQYWIAQQPLKFLHQAPVLDQPLYMEGELTGSDFIVNDWQVLPHHRIFELSDEIWLEGFPLSDAELFIDGFEVTLPEFTDDLFDPDDTIRIGIDHDEQEFWMDHEPPEDNDQWQNNDWRREDSAQESFEYDLDVLDYDDDDYGEDGFEPEDFEFDYYEPEFDESEYYEP